MKISVITVCYNVFDSIEETILSVIKQSYKDVEYIIIDGGSTDGTLDVVKKYASQISYWISEPDSGIYDAMNKGIKIATGEWIGFMNSGDIYSDLYVLEDIFGHDDRDDVDVIYGHSIRKLSRGDFILETSSSKIEQLKFTACYRHGSSFVRSFIHKKYLFDLSKTQFNYALDFNCIHSLYMNHFQFKQVDRYIMIYKEEGVSNCPIKSAYYNLLISIQDCYSYRPFYYLIRACIGSFFRKFLKINI